MAVKMEHVLILLIAVFLLYHFVGRCRCNGFSVGGPKCPYPDPKTGEIKYDCGRSTKRHRHHNLASQQEPSTTHSAWEDITEWWDDF